MMMSLTNQGNGQERSRMSNKIIVFAGPSLAGVDMDAFCPFEFRPPCKQGDVFLACGDAPAAIAIIDGYFEGQPSVWHKEVLYALSEGIHVYGSSSMGALRAAETHMFGMRGVGAVFEAYRDGRINDDDEVGLVHGPEELGYMPLSEPMVNIRATCALAVEHNILSSSLADEVCKIAKADFYKDRTWDRVMNALASADVSNLDVPMFAKWIADNALDQKKLDALALLNELNEEVLSKPFKAEFEFIVTEFWHRCTSSWISRKNHKPTKQETRNSEEFKLFG